MIVPVPTPMVAASRVVSPPSLPGEPPQAAARIEITAAPPNRIDRIVRPQRRRRPIFPPKAPLVWAEGESSVPFDTMAGPVKAIPTAGAARAFGVAQLVDKVFAETRVKGTSPGHVGFRAEMSGPSGPS